MKPHSTLLPASTSFSAATICSWENLLVFMTSSLLPVEEKSRFRWLRIRGAGHSLEAIAGPDIAIAEGRFATGARLGARAGSATLRGKKNETERSDDHRDQHTSKTVPDSFPLRCGSRAERGLFRRRGSRVKTLLVDRRQPSK